ncbi:MAG: YceI family protein [Gemmatimonadales bacterium]
MIRAYSAMLFFTIAASRPAAAQAIPDGIVAHGTLSFDADATLGAFTGVTHDMTGELRGASALGGVRGWVEAKTATLTTKNGHRDRDMAKSLDLPQYPTMRFTVDSLTPGQRHGDSTAVTVHGRFTIHGTTKPAIIDGWVAVTSDSARFHGSTPMDVKDYGVGHLSKALGIFKMNEHITVHIDVTFAPHH